MAAATDVLGGCEQLAAMTHGPTAALGVMVETAGSSGAEAGVAGGASESGAKKLVVPEEQTTLPKASKGMVGHAVWPPSPLVVPPVAEEEDGVEEIERKES